MTTPIIENILAWTRDYQSFTVHQYKGYVVGNEVRYTAWALDEYRRRGVPQLADEEKNKIYTIKSIIIIREKVKKFRIIKDGKSKRATLERVCFNLGRGHPGVPADWIEKVRRPYGLHPARV